MLDLSKIKDSEFTHFLMNVEWSEIEGIVPRIAAFLRTQGVNMITWAYKKLTLLQLEELSRTLSDVSLGSSWLDAVLVKKFQVPQKMSYEDLEQLLERAFSYLTSLPGNLTLYRFQCLRSLLVLRLHMNKYQERDFITYLQLKKELKYRWDDPLNQFQASVDQHVPHMTTDDQLIEEYLNRFLVVDCDFCVLTLVKECLNMILNSGRNVYSAYFDKDDLSRRIARANLLAGREPNIYSLSPQYLNDLADSTELEIDRNNPQSFSVSSSVFLNIRRKNVPKLTVTVVEIDTENYYRSHNSPIRTDFNLDGIISKYERVLENADSPLMRVTENITFPELDGKAGLFVVEVMESGRHTRAWIRKGSLRYVSKPTVAGYMISIYSQEGVLQKTNHTGVILDGKMYERSGDKDYIMLPYAQQASKKTLVLVADNLAELVEDFTHEGEEYSLKAAFLLQQESLVSGERASVLIKPSVYINQFAAPLALLERVSARVSTVDFKGLRSTQVFPSLTFGYEKDTCLLEFDVPLGVQQVKVELSAEVKQLNTNEYSKLQAKGTFFANEQSASSVYFDFYLQWHTENGSTEPSYEIQVLGRNGEGIRNAVVDLTLQTLYSQNSLVVTLSSDSQGKIDLGQLPTVTQIRAEARYQDSPKRTWDLNSYRSKVQYPELINLTTRDTLVFPLVKSFLRTPPSLLQMYDDSVLSREALVIETKTNTVTLSHLSEGTYCLRLPDQKTITTIRLLVKDGTHLDNGFVISDTLIRPGTLNAYPVGITAVQFQPSSVSVQLNGAYSNAEVTVLLRNFHDDAPSQRWNMLTSLKGKAMKSFAAPKPEVLYLSSRLLDEEYRYILDRKYAPKEPSIAFPLPSMLIQPKLVHDTDTDVQVPREGTNFNSRTADSYGREGEFNNRGFVYTWNGSPGQYYEFLNKSATLVFSGKVNSEGLLQIQIPELEQYGIAEVIATNLDAVAQETFALSKNPLAKKAVALQAALESTKHYAEVRSGKHLRSGERFSIDAMNSFNFAMIDSVEKLLGVLIQLGEAKNKLDSSVRDWAFLGKWGNMSRADKEQLYNRYASHELNFFIYHKDKLFFEKVVQPLITAKMEKTFIDDLLLGRSLEHYLTLQNIKQMPTLELALLAKLTKDSKLRKMLNDKKQASASNVDDKRWLFDALLQFSREGLLVPEKLPKPTQKEDMREVLFLQDFDGFMPNDGYDGNDEAEPDDEEEHHDRGEGFSGANKRRLNDGMDERREYKRYFKQIDLTREYAETQYYGNKLDPASFEFWSAVAESSGSSILTETVVEAYSSLTEVVMAVALTDLPWTPTKRALFSTGQSTEVTVESNCLLFHKDVQVVPAQLAEEIAIAQFYSESEKTDNQQLSEFVQTKVYTSKVVITNMSAKPLFAEVLMQVPQGSIPIASFSNEQIETLELAPYTTSSVSYRFYFPAAGIFQHASTYVSIDGVVLRNSPARTLHVLEKATTLNLESFTDIARAGNVSAITHFLETKNINDPKLSIDYSELHWLMSNFTVFDIITATLRNRLVYVPSIWAYSLMHGSIPELKELLQTDNFVIGLLGYHFTSSLVSTTRGKFRHLEYFPLVNARAHPLGNQPRIANQNFRESYDNFLLYLAEKQQLDVEDRLSLAQYFVLQSRYEEATEQVQAVDPNDLSDGFLLLQYDYMRAYLNTTAAKELIGKYENYPLLTWRDKFTEIQAQLKEIDAISGPVTSKTPVLTASMSAGTLQIYSENLNSCLIKLRQINLEVLFSRSPFLSKEMGSCAYTAPTHFEKIPLISGSSVNYTLPQSLIRENQFIELQYAGKVWSQLYLSSGLRVQTHTETGDLKVTGETYHALPGVYVKVYALNDQNEAAFYKDGYTDMRGRFNYATLSTNQLQSTVKFSILVADDALGSTVLEVSPPPR